MSLGIECGGSDATSGIASNPAVGELSDLLVDLGATTMMSESIEWCLFGCPKPCHKTDVSCKIVVWIKLEDSANRYR